MKYCPNCGAELKENSKFCSLCGKRLLAEGKTNGLKTDITVLSQKMRSEIKSFLKKNQGKVTRKQLIGSGIILAALFAILLVVFSSRTLTKVIPGNVYYINTLNRYVAFGSGKYSEYMIVTDSKEGALKSVTSEKNFENMYDATTVDIKTEVGLGISEYKVTKDQLILTTKQSYVPYTDHFANNSTEVVTDFWGGLATSILAPMIEEDINRSINRKNLQIVDTRMDITNVKISGWFKHKITGTVVVDGKKQRAVLEEVKN